MIASKCQLPVNVVNSLLAPSSTKHSDSVLVIKITVEVYHEENFDGEVVLNKVFGQKSVYMINRV